MKKSKIYFLILVLSILAFNLKAQESTQTKIYDTAEKMPQFKGGEPKMAEYLKSNLKYPADARQSKISGIVYISFVVDEQGAITQVMPMREVEGDKEHSLTKEAIRVISAMPAWKPAMEKGKAVAVRYSLPVKFDLK